MEDSKSPSDTSSAVISPSTFHPFPNLPTELRLQIWHLSIPEAVYIHFSRHPDQDHVSQHLIARCSPHAIPPLLHTNSEARFVALPYYQILGTGSSRAYFNPDIDILMLGLIFRTNFENLVRYPTMVLGESVGKVKHVVVYNLPFYAGWFQKRMLGNFGALESFAVLDLKEWEEGTSRWGTRGGPSGAMDYEALREVLRPAVLRLEKLVEVTDEELLLPAKGEFRRLVGQVRGVWKGLNEKGLDVKVVRLPFPGVEEGEGFKGRVWSMSTGGLKEQNVTRGNVTGKRTGNGSLRKPWRYLRKLLSKSAL